jgi:iron complex transport system substrate-binding protein
VGEAGGIAGSVIPALSRERTGFLSRLFMSGVFAPLVIGLLLPAPASAQRSSSATDDLGRFLRLDVPPTRIVSLVPAITELLYALGEGDRLVGRSVWDDQPEQVLDVPSVGDALRADAERVLARNPDLVVLYAGSDNARSVEQFDRLGLPSLAIRIDDLADLRRNTLRLGSILDRDERARELWASIERDLDEVAEVTAGLVHPSVYYDIAWPPAITVGSGSYLDTLITIAGGRNVFSDLGSPSPQVSLEAIVARSPQIILLPGGVSGGSARPRERPGWDAVPAVREGSVRRVDAGLLHRLGPRIGEAARSLARVLHPQIEFGQSLEAGSIRRSADAPP